MVLLDQSCRELELIIRFHFIAGEIVTSLKPTVTLTKENPEENEGMWDIRMQISVQTHSQDFSFMR